MKRKKKVSEFLEVLAKLMTDYGIEELQPEIGDQPYYSDKIPELYLEAGKHCIDLHSNGATPFGLRMTAREVRLGES